MEISKLKIVVLFALCLVVLSTISSVDARVSKQNEDANDGSCENEGFNCECQDFYNDSHYYAIAKWSLNGNKYKVDEQNDLYRYYNINVNGTAKSASWTSNPKVGSVLVKAGNNRVEFNGGSSGSVDSNKDISHITFCGYRVNDGGCVGSDCGSNGVPEFPAASLGIAVLVATLGLVLLRKN